MDQDEIRRKAEKKDEINRQVEQYEPSRPGPKSIAAMVLVVLAVMLISHLPEVQAAIDAIT